MNRKKRLKSGRFWAKNYDKPGSIIRAYSRKFKVTKSCAINDLTSFGINLNIEEIDNIRLNLHNYGIQQLPKKKLRESEERITFFDDDFDGF